MSDSQCAVFHFDIKTMSARDAQGLEPSAGNDTPVISDTLAEAEHYCQDKIAALPSLGCRILDHTAQS
jgi:hypothetical protein